MSTCIQRLLKMKRLASAAKRYYGHRNRRRHALDRLEVVAPHHAVTVNGIEYELTGAAIDKTSGNVDNILPKVTPLDVDPAHTAAIKSFQAAYDRLCAAFLCSFFDEPAPPQRPVTATELVSAMREAALKIRHRLKPAAYREWHEAARREILDELEVGSPLLWSRANIENYKLINTPGLVNLNLLTD